MRTVMKTYGRFLLAGITSVLLLVLCMSVITDDRGNRGFFRIIGAQMEIESADYKEYTDYDAYGAESAKSFPEITVRAAVSIHMGINIISDYVQAIDFAGEALPVRILKLENENGDDISGWCDTDNGSINFGEPGIYTLTLAATDSGNRETKMCVRLPVIR